MRDNSDGGGDAFETRDLRGNLRSTAFGLFFFPSLLCLRKYFPLKVQLDLCIKVQWRRRIWTRGVFSVYALIK